MNNTERIKQAEEMISKANAMIEEANKIIAEVKEAPDVLAEYKNHFGSGGNIYFLGDSGQIRSLDNESDYEYWNTESDPYVNYPVRAYAEIASELSQFNNKLLAFKWCYDRDFEPDWSNRNESKYFIYYDSCANVYSYAVYSTISSNAVYFSSEEIAQKCCDWLNSELEKEADE